MGSQPVSITYQQVEQWPGGFADQITIRGLSGTKTQAWSLAFAYPGARIYEFDDDGAHAGLELGNEGLLIGPLMHLGGLRLGRGHAAEDGEAVRNAMRVIKRGLINRAAVLHEFGEGAPSLPFD